MTIDFNLESKAAVKCSHFFVKWYGGLVWYGKTKMMTTMTMTMTITMTMTVTVTAMVMMIVVVI